MSHHGHRLLGMTGQPSSPLSSIPVFFRKEMAAENQSFSPSASKPAAVVASWSQLDYPLRFIEAPPLTRDELKRAHDPTHVDDILDGRKANGFANTSADVARSLPHTNGAMLAAAREALVNGLVAVAPCSGFHHAGFSEAAGYCTFNGLMVTALALKASGEVRRVGILDFDEHYGDGTDDIIKYLKIDWIAHHTEGREYHLPTDAEPFLARIPSIVRAMQGCDVILYQAGADPHVDDPLGGWLTTEQIFERDVRVFDAARRLGLPVAWNLAGGYQTPLRKVLDIHDNTMRACGAAYLTLRS